MVETELEAMVLTANSDWGAGSTPKGATEASILLSGIWGPRRLSRFAEKSLGSNRISKEAAGIWGSISNLSKLYARFEPML